MLTATPPGSESCPAASSTRLVPLTLVRTAGGKTPVSKPASKASTPSAASWYDVEPTGGVDGDVLDGGEVRGEELAAGIHGRLVAHGLFGVRIDLPDVGGAGPEREALELTHVDVAVVAHGETGGHRLGRDLRDGRPHRPREGGRWRPSPGSSRATVGDLPPVTLTRRMLLWAASATIGVAVAEDGQGVGVRLLRDPFEVVGIGVGGLVRARCRTSGRPGP